jgi:hypothetical protein
MRSRCCPAHYLAHTHVRCANPGTSLLCTCLAYLLRMLLLLLMVVPSSSVTIYSSFCASSAGSSCSSSLLLPFLEAMADR